MAPRARQTLGCTLLSSRPSRRFVQRRSLSLFHQSIAWGFVHAVQKARGAARRLLHIHRSARCRRPTSALFQMPLLLPTFPTYPALPAGAISRGGTSCLLLVTSRACWAQNCLVCLGAVNAVHMTRVPLWRTHGGCICYASHLLSPPERASAQNSAFLVPSTPYNDVLALDINHTFRRVVHAELCLFRAINAV